MKDFFFFALPCAPPCVFPNSHNRILISEKKTTKQNKQTKNNIFWSMILSSSPQLPVKPHLSVEGTS